MSILGEGGLPSKLGRYELITRIGQGGMAEVQLAIQRGPAGFEKLVVVKLVHENLASQKTFVDMLLDEARVAALVKHPNVVDIYDLGEVDGRYFIAMEYLEGEPLLAVLRAGREGQRLDVYSTARLIADTAEGLEAAHALKSMGGEPIELVHHDVSLGNIVVLYNGQVKLVDFGVAKATQSATTRSKVQGKFSYMAPEKMRGSTGDRRSDIFSLGCVLWEALTLKRLFKGGNDSETMQQVLEAQILPPSQVNGDVPASLDPIVMRALERDADKRYSTAQQMADDLEAVLTEERYGRKNEPIARYMQETFKAHIDARKKLLQEVSSKGRASADILEAAFNDPATLASGSPVGGEFSIRFKRVTFETPPSGAPTTPPSVVEPPPAPMAAPPPPRPTSPPLTVKRTTPPPMDVAVPRAIPRQDSEPAAIYDRPTDEMRTKAAGDEPRSPAKEPLTTPPAGTPIVRALTEAESDLPPVKSRRTAYFVIGFVVVLAWIVIAIVVFLGRTRPSDDLPTPKPRPHVPAGSAAAATPGSAAAPVVAGSDAAAKPATESAPIKPAVADVEPDIEIDKPTDKPIDKPIDKPGKPTDKPVAKPNADALYKTGLQAYMRGDNKSALAALKSARAANPTSAPTWRVLGLIYERTKDAAQARVAFTRYLALAPAAPDAQVIRGKLEALGP